MIDDRWAAFWFVFGEVMKWFIGIGWLIALLIAGGVWR